ncbi:hypothetical protein AWB64_04315 [Caballeronia sordidicola]|uniref:Uncharacterized protein n=1 Tax=Caballeronia sordidicola TaxID=196367 RepID=A0A158H801_CABSO|nr:hypothetical protein [Caballeronia sordidicola]SAL40532.1 hypothetical protein AWB64_04315 [Caballeronia sordidicola]
MNAIAAQTLADNTATRLCRNCRHREHDRAALEAMIPGLGSFGSAFGASLGESRLCRLRDQLVSPRDSCAQFSEQ